MISFKDVDSKMDEFIRNFKFQMIDIQDDLKKTECEYMLKFEKLTDQENELLSRERNIITKEEELKSLEEKLIHERSALEALKRNIEEVTENLKTLQKIQEIKEVEFKEKEGVILKSEQDLSNRIFGIDIREKEINVAEQKLNEKIKYYNLGKEKNEQIRI